MIVRDYQGQCSERSHSLWPQASLGGLSSPTAKNTGNAEKHPQHPMSESPSIFLIQHHIPLVLTGNRTLPSPSRPQVQCKHSDLKRENNKRTHKNSKEKTPKPENSTCTIIALGLSPISLVTLLKINAVRCQELSRNKQLGSCSLLT